MLTWLVPAMLKKIPSLIVRRPVAEHWRMAIRAARTPIFDSGGQPDMEGFRWIESPKGRFHADPFLLDVQGKMYLFFEDLDYAANRGRISCCSVTGETLGPVIPVLERPYHLSYPHVFWDNGRLFMIPESRENGTVDLYSCVEFPGKWQLDRCLFEGHAVDTTLWVEGGVYWFFTTLQEPRGGATQLWLFWADSLTGEWNSHPENPISTDVRNARGAGAMFRRNGHLYRPSQNCGPHYGYSFQLNKVVTLTKESYQEVPGEQVPPTWSDRMVATHTYSLAEGLEVIDGCCRFPSADVV